MMRLFLLMFMFVVGAPAAAQPVQQPLAPPLSAPVWNPAMDYVTVGQDEPGYRNWYMATPRHALQVNAFNQYLNTWQVGGVVPTWQLLRTASTWAKCGAQPFEVPPTNEWPNVVQTLRYIRDYVVPAIGPVEPVSAYRNPVLNACAGGAPQSAHQHFSAVDLVPLRSTTRERLMQTLCAIHLRDGSPYQVGLGFYAFLRFHVDSVRFRKWGAANGAASCAVPLTQPVLARAVAPPAGSEQIQVPTAQPAPPASSGADPLAPESTSTETPAH